MTTQFQLFFGRNIPSNKIDIVGSKTVTNKMWKSFKSSVLDKTFEGYTIQDANGVWKGDLEATKIVTILSFDSDDELKVRDIVNKYKTAFQQECVLVTSMEIHAMFL
jgi:hypothetical protein